MTYGDRLARVLQCFANSRGQVLLEGRSLSGIDSGAQVLLRTQGLIHAPLPLLKPLADGLSFRVHVATRNGQSIADVPVLVAKWRLPTAFYGSRRIARAADAGAAPVCRYFITEFGRGLLKAALELAPPPSFLVAGGAEVAAGWRLVTPLGVGAAAPALAELATRLGAELPPSDLRTFSVPLCGLVRNWNNNPSEPITIDVAEPARMYALADFTRSDNPADPPKESTAHARRDRDPEPSARRRRATV
jgi:hypothetical protein